MSELLLPEIFSLWHKTTFMPHDTPSRSEMLLEELWKNRQASFIVTSLKLFEWDSKLCQDTRYLDCFDEFMNLSPLSRRSLTEDPVFRIWLKKIIKISSNLTKLDNSKTINDLRNLISDFRRIIHQFQEKSKSNIILNIGDSCIQVKRFDVDPLITQVAPPSYQFPSLESRKKIEANTVYKLHFFLEVLDAAFDRIKDSWFSAYIDFSKFVDTIIHVPNANFRSCSAERYSGIIFLSYNDTCLLDVEESLIHEYGHQILYNVMEIDPLIIDGNKGKFKLPWSKRERDLYGYFHAFYIYIILIIYFERVKVRSEEEEIMVNQKISHILSGLIKAIPHFESANQFTQKGRDLFLYLKNEVSKIKDRHREKIN
jgi:hypothetical protein